MGCPPTGAHRACSWSSEFCVLSPRAEQQCGQAVTGRCLSTDTGATWTTQSRADEFNPVGDRGSGYSRAAAGGDGGGRGLRPTAAATQDTRPGAAGAEPVHASLPLLTNTPHAQSSPEGLLLTPVSETRNRSVPLQGVSRSRQFSVGLPGPATGGVSLDRHDEPPPPPASQPCPGQTWTVEARPTE